VAVNDTPDGVEWSLADAPVDDERPDATTP
jgi:hypothetical protein